MGRWATAIAFTVLAGVAVCTQGADSSGVVVTPHALFALDAGQVRRGTIQKDIDTGKVWQEHVLAQFALDATIRQRTRIVLAAEALVRFSFPMYYSQNRTFPPLTSFYFHQAEGSFKVGPLDRPWFELGVGVFPFKYNPDVRNLGEYLFRTGTYPPSILSTFDFPLARLLGFRVSSNLDFGHGAVSFLRQDGLLSITNGIYPYQPSLSYILSAGFARRIVEVGAGVSATHVVPVYGEGYVSLRHSNNVYLTNVARDSSGNITSADTNYYTFRGAKIMARLAFDPKRIWAPDGEFGIFGANDLRFYCETAILGVKNYPRSNADSTVAYANRRERWPVVVGFNLPVFRALDVLALEVEYFGSRIANDYENGLDPRLPLPQNIGTGRNPREDDIKWSVYAARDIGRILSIHAMTANDHVRIYAEDKRAVGTEEVLRKSDSWHYMLRFMCRF